MAYNPKTVQIRFIMPDDFYDEHDDLTQAGYDAIAELMEYGNLEFVGIEQ